MFLFLQPSPLSLEISLIRRGLHLSTEGFGFLVGLSNPSDPNAAGEPLRLGPFSDVVCFCRRRRSVPSRLVKDH